MIDPVQLLLKTAANYIAFKAVKTSVDYSWNRRQQSDQYYKAVECTICLQIWRNHPEECPHCGNTDLIKLYRDFEYKNEEDGFEIDTNLTARGR